VSDGAEVYRRDRRRLGARPADLSFEGLLRDNGVATLTVLARRTALEAVGGFDEDRRLIAVEDYDLWLRLAERYPLGCVDAALARYHRRTGSLSGPRRFLEGVRRVLAKALRRHAESPELRAIVKDREQALHLDLAWQLLESRQAAEALVPILEALALSPSRARAWKLLARAGAESFGWGRASRLVRRP
jgi:GT2 family glycosyltransferase